MSPNTLALALILSMILWPIPAILIHLIRTK